MTGRAEIEIADMRNLKSSDCHAAEVAGEKIAMRKHEIIRAWALWYIISCAVSDLLVAISG